MKMIGQQQKSLVRVTIIVSYLITVVLLCNSRYTTTAFQGITLTTVGHPTMRTSTPTTSTSSTVLNLFGNLFGSNKSKNNTAEEAAKRERCFWNGRWVCKDCGYIYNRTECAGLYFEEQGPGFLCPQCSGLRHRYAKAVGYDVGTVEYTRDDN